MPSKIPRKVRFLLSVSAIILLGGMILYVQEQSPDLELAVEKTCFMCTRCGGQVFGRELGFFGFHLYRSAEFSEPRSSGISGMDVNRCSHKMMFLGSSHKGCDFAQLKLKSAKLGFPDGDFFTTAPALQAVISSFAHTNLQKSEVLLNFVRTWRLGEGDTITNSLPAFFSTNIVLLKQQLEAEYTLFHLSEGKAWSNHPSQPWVD